MLSQKFLPLCLAVFENEKNVETTQYFYFKYLSEY